MDQIQHKRVDVGDLNLQIVEIGLGTNSHPKEVVIFKYFFGYPYKSQAFYSYN